MRSHRAPCSDLPQISLFLHNEKDQYPNWAITLISTSAVLMERY